MKLEYTEEDFIDNFIKDSETFGEDLTKEIYEELFSTISGQKINLDNFVEELNNRQPLDQILEDIIYDNIEADVIEEAPADFLGKREAKEAAKLLAAKNSNLINNYTSKELLGQAAAIGPDATKKMEELMLVFSKGDPVKTAVTKDLIAASHTVDWTKAAAEANIARNGGLLQKLGLWFKKFPMKVKSFFGGLKGKSFSEILNKGFAWVKSNPKAVMGSAGGIVLLALLVKALKNKKKYNNPEFANVVEAYEMKETIIEECSNEYVEQTPAIIAMKRILKECETNENLKNLIFEKEEKKKVNKWYEI